jgi:hypothetical protein
MNHVKQFKRVIENRAEVAHRWFGCRTVAEAAKRVWADPEVRALAEHPDAARSWCIRSKASRPVTISTAGAATWAMHSLIWFCGWRRTSAVARCLTARPARRARRCEAPPERASLLGCPQRAETGRRGSGRMGHFET